jgi:hydrogenase maturation protein HypF
VTSVTTAITVIRTAVRVDGIVQGVGFRPFVYALATRLGLGGFVGNDVDGVFAEVEGQPAAVREFLRAIAEEAPPLARIDRVTTTTMAPAGTASFEIAASGPQASGPQASNTAGPRRTLIAADTATCADCLRELADPADRRHRYPFPGRSCCFPGGRKRMWPHRPRPGAGSWGSCCLTRRCTTCCSRLWAVRWC